MDPITLISTAGSILGGGGIFAGINLLNGHLQRKFQEAENDRQREFQRQMQDRQMEFQLALKEMDYRHSERVQREMLSLQFQNSMKLQEEAWERNTNYENVWPLRDPPTPFVMDIRKAYSYGRIPLLSLIPNTLTDQIESIGRVIKDVYSEKSLSPVIYYDGGWKDEAKTIRGNALLRNLHKVLNGMPTLVLLPSVANRSFSLDIGYWGFGVSGALPESMTIIPEIDIREIEVNLIRAYANEKIAIYADEKEMLANDKNVQLRLKELDRRETLKAKGNAEDVIAMKLRGEFFNNYSKNGIEAGKIDREVRSVIRMLLDVVCAAYADVYHLIESKIAPLAPLIAKENALFRHPSVRSILVRTYRAAIDSLQSDKISRILDCPLCCALVAESLHKAGWDAESSEFGKQAEAMLLQLYEKPTRNIADAHRVALELLTDNACVGKDSLVVQKLWNPDMRHLHYEHVIASKTVGVWSHDPGWNWEDGKGVTNLRTIWTPGERHPSVIHAYAGPNENEWLTDAGYLPNDPNNILKGTHWQKDLRRDDIPYVFSAEIEGCWCADPGYVFNDKNDVRKGVHWQSGQYHPTVPHAYADDTEGFWITDPGYVFSINDNSYSFQDERSLRRASGFEVAFGTRWKPNMTHPYKEDLVSSLTEGEWIDKSSRYEPEEEKEPFDLFRWELENWSAYP